MKNTMIKGFIVSIIMTLMCAAVCYAQEDYMICEDVENYEDIELSAAEDGDTFDAEEETYPDPEELFAQSDDEDDDGDDGGDDEGEGDEEEEETEKVPEAITRVDISGAELGLAAYKKPIYNANIKYANAEVSYEGWVCEDGRVNYSEKSAYKNNEVPFTKFEEGKMYQYIISIAAKDDDFFLRSTVFSFCGRELTGGEFNVSMNMCTFTGVYAGRSSCYHKYNTLKEAATCVKSGRTYKKCKYCGTEEILSMTQPTGHKFELDEDESCASTCTATGRRVYRCENEGCGSTKTIMLPAMGHKIALSIEEPATGSEEGMYYYACTREDCGYHQKNQTIFPYKKVNFSRTKYAYTGSTITPSFTVVDIRGRIIDPKYYTVVCLHGKNVGKATLHITFTEMYSGTLKAEYQIVKASQSISVSHTSFTLKKADLKKKAAAINLGTKAKTKLSYTSSSKYVKVSNGKIKVKKGTPKGTYTVKIKAASSKNYKEATKKIKIKVK